MLFLIAGSLVALVAALYDWRSGRIPNWLTYSTLVSAPPLHALLAWSVGGTLPQILTTLGVSLLGAALCGLLPLILWLKGACGGGDVKLFAALGALLEPLMGMEAQVYSYYIAAIFVPLGLLYQGRFWQALRGSFQIVLNGFRPKAKRVLLESSTRTWFRLGPAIFGGCVLTTFLHWGR